MSGDGVRRPSTPRRSRSTRRLRADDRAQTVLDFVVGMSVFLTVVGFTFAFVPSLLEPYTVGEGATVIVAERGAAQLAESSLVGAGPPATLSSVCAADFFNGTDPDSDCGLKTNADDLHSELGAAEVRGLNLTVSRDGDITPVLDGEGNSVRMRAGPVPPQSESVSAASRIVALDADRDGKRETHRLTLRVW